MCELHHRDEYVKEMLTAADPAGSMWIRHDVENHLCGPSTSPSAMLSFLLWTCDSDLLLLVSPTASLFTLTNEGIGGKIRFRSLGLFCLPNLVAHPLFFFVSSGIVGVGSIFLIDFAIFII